MSVARVSPTPPPPPAATTTTTTAAAAAATAAATASSVSVSGSGAVSVSGTSTDSFFAMPFNQFYTAADAARAHSSYAQFSAAFAGPAIFNKAAEAAAAVSASASASATAAAAQATSGSSAGQAGAASAAGSKGAAEAESGADAGAQAQEAGAAAYGAHPYPGSVRAMPADVQHSPPVLNASQPPFTSFQSMPFEPLQQAPQQPAQSAAQQATAGSPTSTTSPTMPAVSSAPASAESAPVGELGDGVAASQAPPSLAQASARSSSSSLPSAAAAASAPHARQPYPSSSSSSSSAAAAAADNLYPGMRRSLSQQELGHGAPANDYYDHQHSLMMHQHQHQHQQQQHHHASARHGHGHGHGHHAHHSQRGASHGYVPHGVNAPPFDAYGAPHMMGDPIASHAPHMPMNMSGASAFHAPTNHPMFDPRDSYAMMQQQQQQAQQVQQVQQQQQSQQPQLGPDQLAHGLVFELRANAPAGFGAPWQSAAQMQPSQQQHPQQHHMMHHHQHMSAQRDMHGLGMNGSGARSTSPGSSSSQWSYHSDPMNGQTVTPPPMMDMWGNAYMADQLDMQSLSLHDQDHMSRASSRSSSSFNMGPSPTPKHTSPPPMRGTRGRQKHMHPHMQADKRVDTRFTTIEQVEGRMYTLCRDQWGCRFLQSKLDENPMNAARVLDELYDHLTDLMTDPFGNYLCQKLVEKCDDDQRVRIIDKVSGEMVAISLNMHGTRAVQKIIECVRTTREAELVRTALQHSVVPLIKDLNGNHVIQRGLNHLGSSHNQFIYDAVAAHCVDVATHRHGCCVLQRCIDHATPMQKLQLLEGVMTNALELIRDPFGNYVVQYALDQNIDQCTRAIVRSMLGNIVSLSKQKFSSNVVEKCIWLADSEVRPALVREIANETNLQLLLADPYGNYVVQTAISVCENSPALLRELVMAIRPLLHSVRNTPQGKRLALRLERISRA